MRDGRNGFAVGIAAVALLVLLLAGSAQAQPRFWNGPDGWSYRTDIDVTNQGSTLTNYSVAVPFGAIASVAIPAGKMRTDCNDVRFHLPSGQNLPYWFNTGSCSQTNAVAWVKIPLMEPNATVGIQMYYGNPSAPKVSDPNQTFIPNTVHVRVSNCDPLSIGIQCPILNHTQAQSARAKTSTLCTASRPGIDHGYVCTNSPPGTNNRDRFTTEYRWLFVVDVAGNWDFRWQADNTSELAWYNDDLAATSGGGHHSVYGDNLAEWTGVYPSVAGRGWWHSFVTSDSTGTEMQRIRILRPGDTVQTMTSANFPGMIFRRPYAPVEPLVVLRSEVALPSAVQNLVVQSTQPQRLDVSWSPPVSTGGAPITGYLVEIGNTPTGPWTFVQNSTATSRLISDLPNGALRYVRVTAHTSRGLGAENVESGTTLDVPSAPPGLIATGGVRQISLSWNAPSTGGSPITNYKILRDGVTLATIGTNRTFVDATLGNGESRDYRVAAINAVGQGPSSATSSATTHSLPSAPAGLTATPGVRQISLSWSAPANGGSPITNYKIHRAGVLLATIGTNTSFVDATLANNASASYTVLAKTAVGDGPLSASASATTFALPDGPTGLTATGGYRQISISWTAPAYDGGTPITNYRINRNGLVIATIGPNTSFVDATLGDGVTRSYNVQSVNAVGNGAYAASAQSATTFNVPGAPVNLVATSGVRQVSLSWAAPGSTGGTPITNYQIHRNSVLLATIGTNTSFVDATLSNGQSATYRIAAVNMVGAGTQSASATQSAFNVPSAPPSLTTTSGFQQISLSWGLPASDGGTPITNYRIYRSNGLLATIGTNRSFVDHQLGNNQFASYQVKAWNAAGEGLGSPIAGTTTFDVPGQPNNLVATGGARSVSLTWGAPFTDGGTPITGYKVYRGAVLAATVGNVTSYVDTGLANSTTYTYSVYAFNIVGDGPSSYPSDATTASPPGAPTGLAANGSFGSAWLSWNAPADDGGSPLTGYRIYRDNAPLASIGTNRSFVDFTLANGQTAHYRVAAITLVGEGAQSASDPATAHDVPPAPPVLTASPQVRKITLAWPLTSGGGAPTTGHKIYRDGYFLAAIGTNLSFVDATLGNGVTATYRVSVVNGVGEGSPSPPESATTFDLPDAPTDLTATPGVRQIALSWTAPASDGGTALTGYAIHRDGAVLATMGTNTSFVDATLADGQGATYAVRATNAAGESAASNAATASAFGRPTAPLDPAGARGVRAITLTWNAPASDGGTPITGYEIRRDGAFLASIGTNTSFTDATLADGEGGDYDVAGVNAAGVGTRTDAVTVAAFDTPTDPDLVTATPGVRQIALDWVAPMSDGGTPITNYRIYRDGPLLAEIGTNTSFVDHELGNGQWAVYHIRAVNAAGEGLPSSVAEATTFNLPTAPSGLTATGGVRSAALAWNAPDGDGGTPITGYQIRRDGAPLATTGTNTSFVDETLANGQAASYTVAAINAAGEGPQSGADSAVAASPPTAPQGLVSTPGVRRISLSWSPPLSDGGSPLVSYHVYREDALVGSVLHPDTSFSDAPLGNGQTATYRVTAENAAAEGPASDSVSATTHTLPDAPANLAATPGIRQIALSWIAPASNGGTPIEGYQIRRDGAPLVVVADKSHVDADLGDAQTATYTVAAITEVGEGPESEIASATTLARSNAPGDLTATPGVRQIGLAWSAAVVNGGPAVTAHHIYRNSLLLATIGTNTSFVDHALGNDEGAEYTVTAVNDVGEGPHSIPAIAITFALPDAPTALTATPGVRQAALSWSAPASDGGSPITNYRIHRDGAPLALIGANASFVDATLANGQTASYRVSAITAVGEGLPSAPADGDAHDLPDAPTGLTATSGVRRVTLSWGAPADDGGSPIVGYRITRNGIHLAEIAANTSFVDATLTNGQSATYKVLAVTAVGDGPNTEDVLGAAFDLPSIPLSLTASGGVRQASLSWSAPASDGGTPVTGYHITRDGVTLATIGPNTSYVDATLANGQSANYRVSAINAAGEGPQTSPASATTFVLPSSPTGLFAVGGVRQISLTWNAPGWDGGSPVTGYRLHRDGVFLAETSTNRSFVDATVPNSTTASYRVSAVTAVGEGSAGNQVSATTHSPPGAPTNILTESGNGTATISWTAPASTGGSPITNYRIHLGPSPINIPLFATIGTNTTFVANGLENGVTYSIHVIAVTAVGPGPESMGVSVKPHRTPDAPTNLIAEGGSRRVTLSWTAPAFDGGRPVTGYDIHKSVNGGPLGFHASLGSNTTFVAEGLVDGANYAFIVKAKNLAGGGPFSASASASPASLPDAPTLTSVSTMQEDIHVQWTLNADGGRPLLHLRLYASTTPSSERWLVATLPPATTSFVDDVPPGTTRSYVVSAVNVLGEGALSNQLSGASLPDPIDPTTPDTYRSCTRDPIAGTATCTTGSTQSITGLAAGARHTCVILADGKVDCWGDNSLGQAADHLSGLPAVQVAAGTAHTCVLLSDGNADCYGDNAFNRATSYIGGDAVAVTAGLSHTCFLRVDTSVVCQGGATYGQIAGRASGVASVVAGSYHTCYVMTGGSVQCDGLNDRGQATPPGLTDATAVVAGAGYSCALRSSAHVVCWGSVASPTGPVQGSAFALAGGKSHACALLDSGNVVCWGSNRDGQSAPYSDGDAIAVAAGESHTCILRAAGDVACWGRNSATDYGQGQAYPEPVEGSPSGPSSALALATPTRMLTIQTPWRPDP